MKLKILRTCNIQGRQHRHGSIFDAGELNTESIQALIDGGHAESLESNRKRDSKGRATGAKAAHEERGQGGPRGSR